MQIKPPAEWDVSQAKAMVSEAQRLVQLGEEGFERNRRMIEEHDHWLDGKGWVGDVGPDPVVAARIRQTVKGMFVADDVLGELVGNVEGGLLEREAAVGFTPKTNEPNPIAPSDTPPIPGEPGPQEPATTQPVQEPDGPSDEQIARSKEMLKTVSLWWDRKHFWSRIGEAVRRATWCGRGPIRLRIKPTNLNGGQLPTNLTAEEAFDLIEIEAPRPDNAGVVTDLTTERYVGIVVSKLNDQDVAEIWTTEGDRGARKTQSRVVKTAAQGRAVSPVDSSPMELGERLPVFELNLDPLITDPMRLGQFQLNYMRTVLSRTVQAAGFKTRFFGNVEPPLYWVDSPPANTPVVKTDVSTGKTLYGIRMPWVLGAGYVTELVGYERTATTAGGVTQDHETPFVQVDEPTDTAFVTNPLNEARAWLYKGGQQGHLGGSNTVQLSGDAYEQARAQFEKYLRKQKGPVEGLVRDVIECAIALAGLMSSDVAGFLDDYRCTVDLHISAGPIRPDAARLAGELHDKQIISLETAMARVGVEDPTAELAALAEDNFADMALQSKRASVIQQWVMAGAELHVAMWFAGMSMEEIEIALTGNVPGLTLPSAPPVPTPNNVPGAPGGPPAAPPNGAPANPPPSGPTPARGKALANLAPSPFSGRPRPNPGAKP